MDTPHGRNQKLMMIGVTVSLIIILLTLILVYSKWKHSYWEKRGVHTLSGCYPIVGHFFNIVAGERWNYIRNAYKLYSEDKYFGVYEFLEPVIYICDKSYIKQILVKDFDHFVDRRHVTNKTDTEKHWFSEMLTAINGRPWKKLRSTVSPAFSSGKIKNMYSIVEKQAKNIIRHCDRKMSEDGKIDLKKSFGCFTMDVIADTAFGIECNSLEKDTTLFTQNAEKVFAFSWKGIFQFILSFYFPKIAKMFNVSLDTEPMRYFKHVSAATLKERRTNKRDRGDFLDLLLDVQEKQDENFNETKDYKITDNTILAQSALFMIAGYDTTANTLTFSAYYLAKHPEIQQKLREELQQIRQDDSFHYHDLMEAKYLDAVVSEVLRLNAPLPILERQCVKDYKLEGTDITITEGMRVGIPTWGLHRDPVYWPEPHEFKPERFLPENKSNIDPFTYMPFGMGPRNCIAMRFALMEVKQCLAEVLFHFDITFAPGYGKLELENGGGIVRPKQDNVVMILNKI